MDFREILLIASKGQGVNNVPVSTSRGAAVEDPSLQVGNVWWVELPGIRIPAPGKIRAPYFLFLDLYTPGS